MVDVRLLDRLEELRRMIGSRPVIVNSGYRCSAYNKEAGGVSGSYHLYGMAADVRTPGVNPVDLLYYAKAAGFRGLGLYANYCHLDIREQYVRWVG